LNGEESEGVARTEKDGCGVDILRKEESVVEMRLGGSLTYRSWRRIGELRLEMVLQGLTRRIQP